MTRPEAIIAMLVLPPPAALPVERMGYRYTCTRKGDPDVIKRDLGTAYVAWRRQDYAGGDAVISVRRHRLQIVRRA